MRLQDIKDTLASFAERRVHLRQHTVNDVVLLHRGARSVSPGHILDRCLIGFRVRHTLRLSPGDVVEILWPDGESITQVIWAEEGPNGCIAGLRIQGESVAAEACTGG